MACRSTRLFVCAVGLLLAGLLGSPVVLCAAPPQALWLSLDSHAWQVLQRVARGTQAVARTWRPHTHADTGPQHIYVVRVDKAERRELARALHRGQAHPVGFLSFDSRHAALAALQHPAASAAGFTPTRPAYRIERQAVVRPLLADVSARRIGNDIQSLASFHNRFYNSTWGAQAADWLAQRWRNMAAGRDDVQVEKVFRGSDAMPSVVLRIRGASQPDQILVLGAHLDSVNWNDSSTQLGFRRAPGADDDASGIADITEVLRVMLRHDYRPARSIHFMAYSGEELGLYGSHYLASRYAARHADVVGVLQLDMTNYQGSADDIYLIDDDTDAQQNAFLEELAAEYLPQLAVGRATCGYGCSDHVSWTNAGYVASFPFEAILGQDNPWIHSAQDTWAHSGGNAHNARKFARLALAWAVELGGGATSELCRRPRAAARQRSARPPRASSGRGPAAVTPPRARTNVTPGRCRPAYRTRPQVLPVR